MGQVCVTKAQRNQGVFRKLYTKMEETPFQEFYVIITDEDAANKRLFEARNAIAF